MSWRSIGPTSWTSSPIKGVARAAETAVTSLLSEVIAIYCTTRWGARVALLDTQQRHSDAFGGRVYKNMVAYDRDSFPRPIARRSQELPPHGGRASALDGWQLDFLSGPSLA